MSGIGVVIIGRNEGARLVACMASVRASQGVASPAVVYVDSHSSDDSVSAARAAGAEVVELDPALPFTAARARNAGAEALFQRHPDVTYVQFVDGDTELDATWLRHACDYLDHHAGIAVVCGRRRERHPEATVFNLLADMEWDTPAGEAAEFGGDAMIRAAVFRKFGGYSAHFIAGEEPEFSARLRLAGWKIARLNHEMTMHDLAMKSPVQWWRRTLRSGHALAQLHHVHGGAPLYFYRKAFRSTLFWTLAVPAVVVILAALASWWLLVLLPLAYVALWGRITRHRLKRGDGWGPSLAYGGFTMFAKFPQLLGMVKFHRNRLRGRQTALIEYKTPVAAASPPAAAAGEGSNVRESGAPGPANPRPLSAGNT